MNEQEMKQQLLLLLKLNNLQREIINKIATQLPDAIPADSESTTLEEMLAMIERTENISSQDESELAGKKAVNDYLIENKLIGDRSIFTKHLSPSIFNNGKGFVKPGNQKHLRQFDTDVLRDIWLAIKNNWETGFYRNAETLNNQFFLNCLTNDENSYVLILQDLPCNNVVPIIYEHKHSELNGHEITLVSSCQEWKKSDWYKRIEKDLNNLSASLRG